ncbi:MAG: 5-formyltetrahydrofolate cyclo-ligase [Anaerobiospirillum succiniciproducens]|uniref:5-formyltetrahydrofolate cyclo-ligase n=1 Tax=Anaerobiospirillum succiniciproducens TaxID=13335 RepID=UPI0023537B9D|nr:5-formyltetrahydrofolate cyclo-ligase [Anaerobiospirillum succiniciproducens]MCI6863828.1 5-formyltetrahydrofolate cyclo-ligase [Anaerobiospirillum succiniciproducens]MDY2797757.1 5-formyltetrahydrofolate cyclo-ligase [Anaerobiospirillum succiniciproducens]
MIVSAYKEWRNNARNEIRQKRKALHEDEVAKCSELVRRVVLEHEFLKQNRCIASYHSFSGEIDTVEINKALRLAGHHMALPVIHPEEKGLMDFYSYEKPEDLILNRFKIPEPVVSAENLVQPHNLEVVIVPLVGFNEKGERLGMGGGYYDRMLKKISCECLTLGLAYDFQLIPEIKSQPWDMPLDEVITPTKHYIFNKKY